MKILIITGQLATPLIHKNLEHYTDHEIYIKTLPIKIASFITPKMITYYLKEKNMITNINNTKTIPLDQIDIIITPGLMQQDTQLITQSLNIPAYKGPTNAADLIHTLNIVDKITLSTTKPANILIRDEQYKEALEIIQNSNEINEKTQNLLKKESNFQIKNIPLGLDFPMRILGEIANAVELTDDQLLKKAQYYIESGADMIDIGMHAGENNPDKAYHMIKLLKDNFSIPISIDTLNPHEIKKALTAECDLILSVDHGNYEDIKKDIIDHNIPAVILPTNYKHNKIPTTPDDKIKQLNKLDKLCSDITTIADPLLDPINSPSITESIITCYKYRKINPLKPLFFGVGNVTELLDTDSNGANAVLSGIAMELGVCILFTPEASLKCKGSIKELKTASNMMYITKLHNSIPKDLGIDLINYKDHYKKEDIDINTNNIPEIEAVADGKFTPDTKGSFKIILKNKKINAILYQQNTKKAVITSTSARAIYEEILRCNLISRMEHAAYLGMELEKAEIALKLDKQYIQDFPIFK